MPICTRCNDGQEKPLSDFRRNKHNKTGYTSVCKDCLAKDDAARHARIRADPVLLAAYRQYQRERYARDPQKQRQAEARYKAKDPEVFAQKHSQRKKRYRATHKQQEKKQQQLYLKAHPEKHAAQQSKRRAFKKNAPVVENVDYALIIKRDRGICQICFKRVKRSERSIDHIVPLSKGGEHSYRNLVLAHISCNSSKGNRIVPQQLRLF